MFSGLPALGWTSLFSSYNQSSPPRGLFSDFSQNEAKITRCGGKPSFPPLRTALHTPQHTGLPSQLRHSHLSPVLLQKVKSKALSCITIGSPQHTQTQKSLVVKAMTSAVTLLATDSTLARSSAEILTSTFTHSHSTIRTVAVATHHLCWKSAHLSKKISKP